MGKGKGGRGARSSRHGGGCDGRKQSSFDRTLDTEMLDAPRQCGERHKQNQNKSSGFHTQLDNNKRRRVGKAARDVSQMQQSIFSDTPHDQRSSARANPLISAFSSHSPVVTSSRPKSGRASIISCVSAMSTQVGRGPYCYKCARTNRKLHQALSDLLERALKDGKKLIDEWAWEAGVSPDHMDCERTMMHTIPEGLRSENEPCHRCKAEMLSHDQSRSTSIFPPQTSQAPDTLGPQLPPAGTSQTPFPQPQQRLSAFFLAARGAFGSEPPSTIASQFPTAGPWTIPNATSVEEQTATHARYAGHLSQAPQSQTQLNLHQQQHQEHASGHLWQTNGLHHTSTQQHPDQTHQRPAVDHVLAKAISNSYMPNWMSKDYYGHPHMPVQNTISVEEAARVQMPQAQKHPIGGHLEHADTILAGSTSMAHEEDKSIQVTDQNRKSRMITPPPSNEMTIPGMLNAETSSGVGASAEITCQSIEKGPRGGLGEGPGQGQSPKLDSPQQEQESVLKYCCEVIPTYAFQQDR